MKFAENLSLKSLAALLLGALLLILLIEFLVIKNKVDNLEESQQRKDYARSAQLGAQQIAYLLEIHSSGKENQSANIVATIEEQDHKLNILGNGGRIENTEIFLSPLSRLPRITFDHLNSKWKNYKTSINTYLSGTQTSPVAPASQVMDTTAVSTDSIASATPAQIKTEPMIMLAGEWLTFSGWYDKLLNDLDQEVQQKKSSFNNLIILFILFDIMLIGSTLFVFHRHFISPLNKLKKNAEDHKQDTTFTSNEIGSLAAQINLILEQLKDATEFVAAIGEGKLDYDYKILDNDYATGQNKLADSLISMQQKLKTLNEEEQRRQWANEGLTKFVDILRSSDDNINTLGDKIISALVKYTNSNQGSLYILNDDDDDNKFLELISLFAFDLKKYQNKKVKLGEGILGQTFLEKETTILTDIPEEYIRITSGLGDAYPRSLLIVPLKVDKNVYGMVELASFKNYQQHEINFVEKLAETIASTLASVKVGQKNRNLIEQFQQQTEEMRAQEEEMRQNMEELQATQEELSRKEQDYLSRIQELESQISSGVTNETVNRLKQEISTKEQEYHNKVRELERKLSEKPAMTDDWELAKEVEKDLRMQLEALRITEIELRKKGSNS